MASEYSYSRFRWWSPVDLNKVVKEFSSYKTKIIQEKKGDDLSLFADFRGEVMVEADTLQAFLSPFRAVLNQKESKLFTVNDMELRKKVLKMYPHDRPTPFPWEFSGEPKFEMEKP
jgi:hypothetical protein